jgi:hypothetical protein
MAKGDHIIVPLFGPTEHHGIDIGDGTVVHWSSGMPGNKSMGDIVSRKLASEIRRSQLAEFGDLSRLRVREYATFYDPDEVVRRALSRVGEKGYCLVGNNCEHFSTWCKTGHHQSEQVKQGVAAMGLFSQVWSVVKAVGSWVVRAAGAVANVVRARNDWAEAIGSASGACREGQQYLISAPATPALPEPVGGPPRLVIQQPVRDDSRLLRLEAKFTDSESSLVRLQDSTALAQKRLELQISVIELVLASSTIDRYANNIKLHLSNLSIHYETLRNVVGLLDFTNRQNRGIRATIKQLNQIIYHLKKSGVLPESCGLEQIQGIDLESKPGAISIARQFRAFEETRHLLIEECRSFLQSLAGNSASVEKIRKASVSVPEWTDVIRSWLNRNVTPSLRRAQEETHRLIAAASDIPTIEDTAQIHALSQESLEPNPIDPGE